MTEAADELYRLQAALAAAEKDRDDLCAAIGFLPGPLAGDRQIVLAEARSLRVAMVEARRRAQDLEGDSLNWQMSVAEYGSGMLKRVWEQRQDFKRRLQQIGGCFADGIEAAASYHDAEARRYAGLGKPFAKKQASHEISAAMIRWRSPAPSDQPSAAETVKACRAALQGYDDALSRREHGGSAAHNCVGALRRIFQPKMFLTVAETNELRGKVNTE